MANASNFTRGFTPASNPERGNNIGAMKWAFIYVKRAKAKTVSYRTLGFPEYGMSNASNFTRGFTPASNPERGNNIWATKWAFIYVKRAKGKNSVTSYIRVPRVANASNFSRGYTIASNPERGNNIMGNASYWRLFVLN